MSTVKIEVQGSHTITLPPERAVLRASISLEGSDAGEVMRYVSRNVGQLKAEAEALYDETSGPVTWFAIGQARSWSHRPWNQDGKQLPLVHTARADLSIRFSDFAALGRFVVQAADIPGFASGGVSWELTEEHQREVERQARQESVRSARAIAQDYADALDLGPVEVRSISGQGDSSSRAEQLMIAGGMPRGLRDSVEGEDLLVPEDIEVESSVMAQFVIRPRSGD